MGFKAQNIIRFLMGTDYRKLVINMTYFRGGLLFGLLWEGANRVTEYIEEEDWDVEITSDKIVKAFNSLPFFWERCTADLIM